MGREARLRAHADFTRVRAGGRSWSHPLLVLVAAPGEGPAAQTRVGVTASRRIGGAVVRNRVRRRLREALRARYARMASGWDLVFIVRAPAAEAAFDALAQAVDMLLSRAGLLQPEAVCAGSPSA